MKASEFHPQKTSCKTTGFRCSGNLPSLRFGRHTGLTRFARWTRIKETAQRKP
jgi:hypothetical protein